MKFSIIIFLCQILVTGSFSFSQNKDTIKTTALTYVIFPSELITSSSLGNYIPQTIREAFISKIEQAGNRVISEDEFKEVTDDVSVYDLDTDEIYEIGDSLHADVAISYSLYEIYQRSTNDYEYYSVSLFAYDIKNKKQIWFAGGETLYNLNNIEKSARDLVWNFMARLISLGY